MASRNDYSNRPSSENPNYRASVDDSAVNSRPATQEEVAYRNGYVEARNEELARPTVYETRENNSAATGVVIGVAIAAIAGLTIAAFALFSQDSQQPTVEVAPIPVKPTQPQTNTNTKTEKTTVIERVRDAAPAPQRTQIIVPNPVQPQTQPQAQPRTTQPQSQPSQSSSQSSQSSQPETSSQSSSESQAPASSSDSMDNSKSSSQSSDSTSTQSDSSSSAQ